MRAMAIMPYVFGVVGIGILVGGLFWVVSTVGFLTSSESATGTIVDIWTEASEDGPVYCYSAAFTTPAGEAVEFDAGACGSSRPRLNSQVAVLYDPTNPWDAKVNSFMQLWLGPIIATGLGLVFTVVGIATFVNQLKSRRQKRWLLENGRRIEAEWTGIEVNLNVAVNERHPYNIIAQWRDPDTDEVHAFESENVWFDSEPQITRDTVEVYIDPDDLTRHHVDVSFITDPNA